MASIGSSDSTTRRALFADFADLTAPSHSQPRTPISLEPNTKPTNFEATIQSRAILRRSTILHVAVGVHQS